MRLFPALIALLCSATCVPAAPPPGIDGTLLFDFEAPDATATWTVRDLTELALTDRWASGGTQAAAITYHRWEEGKEQWPAVLALATGNALPVTDFSGYDAIEFEVHNPNDFPAGINLHLRDAAGERFAAPNMVPPKTTITVHANIDTTGNLAVSDIAELHLYVTRPTQTYTVYVDNIRLVLNLPGDAAELAKQAEESALTAREELGRLGEDDRELQRQVQRAEALARRAQRFRTELESLTFTTWADVEAQKARLARLQEQFRQSESIVPRMRAIAYAREVGADQFVLATESAAKKVFIEHGRLESPLGNSYCLAAARNERESFQVVVVPLRTALQDVSWSLSPIVGKGGAELPASVRLVGYVDCRQPSYQVPHTGWWPDPLIDFMDGVQEVPLGEVLPLWLTVDVPEQAEAGIYRGVLTVTAQGAAPQRVDIALEVWDFAIPRHTHLRTALSLRGLTEKLYPKEQLPQMLAKYEDWMLSEYKLNPGSIYGGPPNWDEARLEELMANGLNAINLGYFNAPRGDDFNAEKYWQSFDALAAKIEAYLPTVEAAGVRDLCYIYCFDERPTEQLDVVFETAERLKMRWPDIEVMTTAYDRTFGLTRENGAAMDIWVPLTPHFDDNAEAIEEARAEGRDIWWYICIGPQHPHANWFVEYPALEGRLLMGAMTAKYEPGGFLYYAVNRWPLNDRPITFGPKTDWNPASYKNNNGDGSFMCAGPEGPLSTIRLENIRDGIEDYEYYLLLRDLLAQKGQPTAVAEVPASVVEDLTHFTQDPAVLAAERERLAREILKLAGTG